MFCVMCGCQLTDSNRAGLICCGCHIARRKQRSLARGPICVNYCYTCGGSYNPQDASIWHQRCIWEHLRTAASTVAATG